MKMRKLDKRHLFDIVCLKSCKGAFALNKEKTNSFCPTSDRNIHVFIKRTGKLPLK